jgi:zinc protease
MRLDAFRPGAWKTSLAAALLLCGAPRLVAQTKAADEALPAAETVLDRFIEVTGGKAAYERRKTEIATGTMEFAAAGIKGTLVSYAEEPSKYYSALDIPGVGKVEMGVSDGVAWEKSALMGPRVKSGEERNQALRDARMNAPYHWRELYGKAETTGVETVNGEECFKVVLTPKEGKPETMFFSKKSGLMLKTAMVASSPMGEVPAEIFMDDYKDFGGLLSPVKTTQKAAGQEFTVMIESMKVNETIPPERFEMPDEIKALLKK